eukprot:CAMPEP_0171123946 /NCGR_PEP_ID=MMETSP0766_2-20121228/108198_1 /TAXON_ID=439317 /ORGANISM="Gambierdiscus australes, Strain CAWD 149" /LENGTH=127 /DNA_ID=CAMNT_0011586837 /DNA_START=81 /DNA_END=461 /DNA_ORIENTATION=-
MERQSSAEKSSVASISWPQAPCTSHIKPSLFSPGPQSKLSPGCARPCGGKRLKLALALVTTWNSSWPPGPMEKRHLWTAGFELSGSMVLNWKLSQEPTRKKMLLGPSARLRQTLELLRGAASSSGII